MGLHRLQEDWEAEQLQGIDCETMSTPSSLMEALQRLATGLDPEASEGDVSAAEEEDTIAAGLSRRIAALEIGSTITLENRDIVEALTQKIKLLQAKKVALLRSCLRHRGLGTKGLRRFCQTFAAPCKWVVQDAFIRVPKP